MHRIPSLALCITLVWTLSAVVPAYAQQPGRVLSHQKISDTEGGFTGMLDDFDQFGTPVASLGDLDGDGVGDLAVGMAHDDDGGHDRGAVWVLFLNTDGMVKAHQKISSTEGGFTGVLDGVRRGGAVAAFVIYSNGWRDAQESQNVFILMACGTRLQTNWPTRVREST